MHAIYSGYNPTPAEIEAACAEIQAGWSYAEKMRRKRARIKIPFYDPHCESRARRALDDRLALQREKSQQATR